MIARQNASLRYSISKNSPFTTKMNSSLSDQPTCSKCDDFWLNSVLWLFVGSCIIFLFYFWIFVVPSFDCCKKAAPKKREVEYFSVAAASDYVKIWQIHASNIDMQPYENPPLVFEPTVKQFVIINTWQSDPENHCVRFITQNRERCNQEKEKLNKNGIPTYTSILGIYYSGAVDKNILVRLSSNMNDSLVKVNEEAPGEKSHNGNIYYYEGFPHFCLRVQIHRCDPDQYRALKKIVLANKA